MPTKADFTSKPAIGGYRPPISLTERQRRVLDAFADEIVPPGGGFPAPSEVGVAGFVARYVAPDGQPAKWFPFFAQAEFTGWLDGFDDRFLTAGADHRITVIQGIEARDPDWFGRIRNMVYSAYYSTPEVVKAINRELVAGRDYRLTPLPYGYSDRMEDWDQSLLARVKGSYTRTGDVVRVDLKGMV